MIPVPYFFLVESPDFFHLLVKSPNSGEDPVCFADKTRHFLDKRRGTVRMARQGEAYSELKSPARVPCG